MTAILAMFGKSTAVLLLALIAARLARRSRASVRHVLLAGAFAVLLALPVVPSIAPTLPVAVPAAAATAVQIFDTRPVMDVAVAAQSTADASTFPPAQRSVWWSSTTLVMTGWFLGAMVCLIPVWRGLKQMRALRASSVPWTDGRTLVRALCRDAGIRRDVDVLLHDSVAGPMTCGALHPAVILPAEARHWRSDDLRRALVHELEHVRRGDWLSHCLARVVAAAYWCHPLVWVAWHRLALEAERACDDAVLRASDATAYADQLVALARRLSTSAAEPQIAMANRRDLGRRVSAVLDERQRRGRAGMWCVGSAIAVAMLVATGVSSVRVVSAATAVAQGARQVFDTASIKPCAAEDTDGSSRVGARPGPATVTPGRLFVPCATAEQIIYIAYASYGARDEDHLINDDMGWFSDATKVRGGPAWAHSQSDRYSIEATAAGAKDRQVLMGSMLRSLFEDRFHLKLHRETEEISLLGLSASSAGFKLKPMKPGDCTTEARSGDAPPAVDAIPQCGSERSGSSKGKVRWTFAGFDLSRLAWQLSRTLGVHVADMTGITDKFVFSFEFQEDPDPVVTEAAIFTALGEQLGLKLAKTKGPRGFIVIDSIDRPTPNVPAGPRPSPSIFDSPVEYWYKLYHDKAY